MSLQNTNGDATIANTTTTTPVAAEMTTNIVVTAKSKDKMDLPTAFMSSLPNAWTSTGLLANGNFRQVVGSTGNTYTIQRQGNVYSCTCPAYMYHNKNKTPSQRTCKHIKELIEGDKSEDICTNTPSPPLALTSLSSLLSLAKPGSTSLPLFSSDESLQSWSPQIQIEQHRQGDPASVRLRAEETFLANQATLAANRAVGVVVRGSVATAIGGVAEEATESDGGSPPHAPLDNTAADLLLYPTTMSPLHQHPSPPLPPPNGTIAHVPTTSTTTPPPPPLQTVVARKRAAARLTQQRCRARKKIEAGKKRKRNTDDGGLNLQTTTKSISADNSALLIAARFSACMECVKAKAKFVVDENETRCRRCIHKNLSCTPQKIQGTLKTKNTPKELQLSISQKFLLKLHNMLQDATSKGFDHIISWSKHKGDHELNLTGSWPGVSSFSSFVIHQPKLVPLILSQYFRSSLCKSFCRRLREYNFTTKRGSAAENFLLKLHNMLQDATSKGFDHIISWSKHKGDHEKNLTGSGPGVVVIHQPKLMPPILSQYFRSSLYKSFCRRLREFNFTTKRGSNKFTNKNTTKVDSSKNNNDDGIDDDDVEDATPVMQSLSTANDNSEKSSGTADDDVVAERRRSGRRQAERPIRFRFNNGVNNNSEEDTSKSDDAFEEGDDTTTSTNTRKHSSSNTVAADATTAGTTGTPSKRVNKRPSRQYNIDRKRSITSSKRPLNTTTIADSTAASLNADVVDSKEDISESIVDSEEDISVSDDNDDDSEESEDISESDDDDNTEEDITDNEGNEQETSSLSLATPKGRSTTPKRRRRKKCKKKNHKRNVDNKIAKGKWKNNKKRKTKREKKKYGYLRHYPGLIFVTNKENPNNPPSLADLPDSMFPIRLSHPQVIDKFTDYALSKDVCDLCGLKSDKKLHLDHIHCRATEIAKTESGLYQKDHKSSSGVFRMFLHPSCNHAMGMLDAIIEKNSKPTPTTDENVTTVTYDPTTVPNKQFFKKLSETFTLSATLQERWSTEDLAVSIRGEESMAIERLGFQPEYGDRAYEKWRTENPGVLPAWTKEEEAKLEEGLKRYGWGDWIMIAGNYVKSKYTVQVGSKAHNSKYFVAKYKNTK